VNVFPAFLKLSGRKVLIVGGGPVAASKVAALQQAGAALHVVAPQICAGIRTAGVAAMFERAFDPVDLDDAWFVVAAATPDVNRHVATEAARRRIFVNAVDDPDNASVYLGGVVRRGGVTFAISTAGAAPALAGILREAFDAALPSDRQLAAWTTRARELRPYWRTAGVSMADRRPHLLRALNALYERPESSPETAP
jgi:uroporphyrin-III C-methyltransferase/precorrin-2 dehydrogenase/sirohydrochlorin ferrochelatase